MKLALGGSMRLHVFALELWCIVVGMAATQAAVSQVNAEAALLRPAEEACGTVEQSGTPILVQVDAGQPGEPLRHIWSYFGYDECNYTTTPHARELMQTLARMFPAPVYLRMHHLLTSGDGTPSLKWSSTNVYTEDAAGNPVYDWRIMDQIMDAVVGAGCGPLVEIGFMPKDLSAKPEPYQADSFAKIGAGASYPPKDYAKWAELIRQWARHSTERYDNVEETWLWELWNEPNISYWRGTVEEYCKLFDYTEQALHEVLPTALLGGPHTAGGGAFLRQFLEHCFRGTNAVTGKLGTRLDYVGFHSKGRTDFVDGHPRMSLGTNLAATRTGFADIAAFPELQGKPVIIGECDPEGAAAMSAKVRPANGYRNGAAYAAYEAALMKHTLDLAQQQGINLQGVVTWAFMFDGREYFEGFRSLATNGIPKPVLNAFRMLGMLRGRRVPVRSHGALGLAYILQHSVREQPDIDGLAAATNDAIQVLIWNYHDDMLSVPPALVRLVVRLPGSAWRRCQVIHYRIDDTHSNAYTRWVALGRPQQPTSQQLAELRTAADLAMLHPPAFYNVQGAEVEVGFALPRYGVSLIEIRRSEE